MKMQKWNIFGDFPLDEYIANISIRATVEDD